MNRLLKDFTRALAERVMKTEPVGSPHYLLTIPASCPTHCSDSSLHVSCSHESPSGDERVPPPVACAHWCMLANAMWA